MKCLVRSLPLACALLAPAVALAAGPRGRPGAGSAAFPVVYEPPTDAAYRPYFEAMQKRQVLEKVSQALGFIRLPSPLLLRTQQCGEANAMYDDKTRSVTFCYEYVKELDDAARASPPPLLGREDVVVGSVVFIFLHEMGHALFDLLRVPVLGHEEDAADQVAAFILLRVGPYEAKRALGGAAWMYKQSAGQRRADESDYADVHALDAQRYYNVLCMAYGSDPKEYAIAAGEGRLPPERSEGCADEYRQVGYAIKKTMAKGVDVKEFRRLKAERARARRPPAP